MPRNGVTTSVTNNVRDAAGNALVRVPHTHTHTHREVQALETAGEAQPSLSSSDHLSGPCSSCQRAHVELVWFAPRIGRFYCDACGPLARQEARGTSARVIRLRLGALGASDDWMRRERDRANARRAQNEGGTVAER